MAVICEKVLQEKDGVLSIIRVIDRLVIGATGADVPAEMPHGQANMTMVIMLKSGDARGRHNLSVSPELPSGGRLPKNQLPVLFEGEDRGINAVINMNLAITEEGLYWFDIILDENQILTRVPLRVLYQPMKTAATG